MIETMTMGGELSRHSTETQVGANELGNARRAKALAEREDAGNEDKEKAVEAFQMLLATQLVKEMRKTLPKGVFGGGAGSDVYESWFDQHIAGALSESDALGLAGMLKVAIGVKETQASGSTEGHTTELADERASKKQGVVQQ